MDIIVVECFTILHMCDTVLDKVELFASVEAAKSYRPTAIDDTLDKGVDAAMDAALSRDGYVYVMRKYPVLE